MSYLPAFLGPSLPHVDRLNFKPNLTRFFDKKRAMSGPETERIIDDSQNEAGTNSGEGLKDELPEQASEANLSDNLLTSVPQSTPDSQPNTPQTFASLKKKDKKAAKNADTSTPSQPTPPLKCTVILLPPAEQPPPELDVWGHLSRAGFQRAAYIARVFNPPKLEKRGWSLLGRRDSERRSSLSLGGESTPLLAGHGHEKGQQSPAASLSTSPFRFFESFLSPRLRAAQPSSPQLAPTSATSNNNPQSFLPITQIIAPKPQLLLGTEINPSKGWVSKSKAGSIGRGFSQLRPRQTVEPLAKSLGIKVDEKYTVDEWKSVVEHIRTVETGTVLVCWERSGLEKIAGALLGPEGVEEARKMGVFLEKVGKKEKKKGKKEKKEGSVGEEEEEEAMFELEEDEAEVEPESATEGREKGKETVSSLSALAAEPAGLGEPTGEVGVEVEAEAHADDESPTKPKAKDKEKEKKKPKKRKDSAMTIDNLDVSQLASVSMDSAPDSRQPSSELAQPEPRSESPKKDKDKDKKKSSAEDKEKPPRIPFPVDSFLSHDTYLLLFPTSLPKFQQLNFQPSSTPNFPEDFDHDDAYSRDRLYLGSNEEQNWDDGDGGLGTGCCWLGGHGCGPGWECSVM